MTFDSEEELYKIKEYYPEAECVMRIMTYNSEAKHNLNSKYGVPMERTNKLL